MVRYSKLFLITFLFLLSTQTIFAGRYYDSATGRWLTVDPKTGKYPELSPYNYALNNPLKNVDPDGKDPTGITESATVVIGGLAILTAFTIHTVEYATNTSYRNQYNSYTASTAHLLNTAVNEIGSFVGNLLNSGKPNSENGNESSESNGTVKEQADNVSKEIGKNSVTLPDGTRVDLKGRGHRNKEGQKIETPHTHEVEQHTNPETGETYTKTKKVPRPTSQEDINKVKQNSNNQ